MRFGLQAQQRRVDIEHQFKVGVSVMRGGFQSSRYRALCRECNFRRHILPIRHPPSLVLNAVLPLPRQRSDMCSVLQVRRPVTARMVAKSFLALGKRLVHEMYRWIRPASLKQRAVSFQALGTRLPEVDSV